MSFVRVSSNKERDFFSSTLNLHARLMKSRTYLACLFLATHMYDFRHVTHFHLLLLGSIRRLGEHALTAKYRWLQLIRLGYTVHFFLLILIYAHEICLLAIGESNIPES